MPLCENGREERPPSFWVRSRLATPMRLIYGYWHHLMREQNMLKADRQSFVRPSFYADLDKTPIKGNTCLNGTDLGRSTRFSASIASPAASLFPGIPKCFWTHQIHTRYLLLSSRCSQSKADEIKGLREMLTKSSAERTPRESQKKLNKNEKEV